MQTNGIPKRELKRKALHLLFGTAILALITALGTRTSLAILFALLIWGVSLSFLIRKGAKLWLLNKAVEGVERENEKEFPGKAVVYFFASAIILTGIFINEPALIIAALSLQIFADTAAALVGMKFGKHRLYRKKTWEGSIACLIVATLCLALFYPLYIAVIAAIVATIVEILPMDDNLWVPIITAAALKALI